jgi:hypothetical protein
VLPDCEATTVHVPDATKVSVEPETVQTLVVLDEKLTVSPDEAVALKVIGVADQA